MTDQELLRDFIARKSENAFAELARRHVDLVYSAALRMVCDAHLAQDVTQGVFIALAKSASQLADRPVLSGWLHRTARNIAANTVRSEVRRHAREQEAAAMHELLGNEPDATWEMISPQLDAALGELDEADRDALMLRYFERKSAREMAAILGTSEEVAQKRVSRAVDRLREFFLKRKLTVGAGGLAALICANAVQSAPIGLAATVSSAVLAGTVVQTSTILTATKTIAMTTIQKSIIVAALASVAGTGIYAKHQNARLHVQIATLQQQQTPLVARVRELTQALADATNENTALQAENGRLSSNVAELRRLEVAAPQTSPDVRSQIQNSEAPSKTGHSTAKDTGRELGNAVVRGDPGALNKIVDMAKAEFDDFNTNSAGLDDAQRGDMARQIFAPLQEAFGIIADAAVQKNQFAVNAIAQSAQIPELNGMVAQSLGTLAAGGNDGALSCLLDYQSYGFLLSSVAGALQPAADAGNQKAIDALAAVAQDSSEQPLWFTAATGLQKAAASGNPVAVDSLAGLLSVPDQNVRNAAISGLKAAAANQNARAIEALRSAGGQSPN